MIYDGSYGILYAKPMCLRVVYEVYFLKQFIFYFTTAAVA